MFLPPVQDAYGARCNERQDRCSAGPLVDPFDDEDGDDGSERNRHLTRS